MDDLTLPDGHDLELGELPALPIDFTPQRTEPMPLDEPRQAVPVYIDSDGAVWTGATPGEERSLLGAILLAFAVLVALVSCVFGGRS